MTIEKRQLSEQNDNFIMLPTVDFCFKELMQNKEVRKGILSALLGKNPEELEDTSYFQQFFNQNIRMRNLEFWM